MNCPFCSNKETKVVDSREDEDTVRRRRECLACEKRFTTYERPEMADLVIIKKDGRRERFDRNKLRGGLQRACEKLPVSMDSIEKMVNEIEQELRTMEGTEITSKMVGSLAMRKLKKIDKVAYIRFASVYKSFEDLDEFEEELKKLKRG